MTTQGATVEEILAYTDTVELLTNDELALVEAALVKETKRARKPPNMPTLPNLNAHDRLLIVRHGRGRRSVVDTEVEN